MSFWVLFLHILGACIWVGGHLYLLVCVVPKAIKNHDSQWLINFESSFEKLGMSALIIQVATGLYMASLMLPKWSLVFDHSSVNPLRLFSILISLKLTWLLLTILTALSAQLLVVPKVKKDTRNPSLRRIFVGHILLVTILALAFVITGVLFRTGF